MNFDPPFTKIPVKLHKFSYYPDFHQFKKKKTYRLRVFQYLRDNDNHSHTLLQRHSIQ